MQQLRWLIERTSIGYGAASRHGDTRVLTLDEPEWDSPTSTTPTTDFFESASSTAWSENAYMAPEHDADTNTIFHSGIYLKALRTIDPHKHKERIEESSGGLLPDPCFWILDTAEFKQWYTRPRDSLLWIKGDPGKGKTMLLCNMIDGLNSMAESEHQKICVASYFFCQASDLRTNSAVAVLRGLIYMLVDCQPMLLSHARKGFCRFAGSNSWESLAKMFSAMIQDRRLAETYVVIDALDECTTDRDLLIDLIAQLSAPTSKVKWLVSSCNMAHIEEGFTMVPKQEISLELDDRSISTALGIYAQRKVVELAKIKGYSNEIQDAICHYLCSNATSSFLWVALVYQDLAKIPAQSNILLKLAEFPAGLDALYTYMLDRICGLDTSKLCVHILAIMSVVYRPITVDELSCFVEGALDEETLIRAIELCSSFLTIHERTILFVHQSAKDFLIAKATNTVFALGMERVHYIIFSQSLQGLLKTLRRDIYGLGAPGFPIDQVKRPEPDPLAAARYSCVYWVKHLVDSIELVRQHGDLHDDGKVDTFFKTKFLYWLESLSLLDSLPDGASSISQLQHLFQKKANPSYFLEARSDNARVEPNERQFANLLRHASMFIQRHMAPIQSNPLQVYTSALIFNPTNNPIKNLFRHEAPGWIIPKLNADDKERTPGGVQALKGLDEQVDSIVFSPDGALLASVSIDGAVQVWNLETGHCLQRLHVDPNSVHSVTFLPNSSTLIIPGMEDSSIQVWDAVTNQMLQALKGHGDTICAIISSPSNDNLLASGSRDHTVKIWDLATGSCLQTLKGHNSSICTLAFSPDGIRLASGSSNCTIKIWDPVNGLCLQTLHRYNVVSTAIAFTPDGTKLVSALNSDGIAIWDVATGQCLHTAFVGAPLRKLRFDVTGSLLHTDRGAISLDFLSGKATSLEPYMRGYWINADSQWVKESSEKLLWLPPDYGKCSSVLLASSMSLVALGSSSGHILVLRLLPK
ncbi:hypothetical protein ACQKWADRAFT_306300 [Trichoderma austrokoningii]